MRQRAISGLALAGFYLFAWQIGAFGAPIFFSQPMRASAFTYQQPIAGGFYMPAAALQERAAAQMAMEASPDLEAFRQFQRFRAYEAWQAQQPEPAEQPQQLAQPPAPAGSAGPLPPPGPAGPSAWGDRYPTLMAKCSKCHGGADPDGGFVLDGTGDLQSPHLAGKRDAIMDAIVNNRMPRKAGTDECEPLTPDELGAVVGELWLK